MTEVKSVETIQVQLGDKMLLLVETKGLPSESVHAHIVAVGRKLNDWLLNSDEPFYSLVYPSQIQLRVERIETGDDQIG